MASDGTIKIKTELDSSSAQAAMSKFGNVAKKGLKSVAVSAIAVKSAIAGISLFAAKTGLEFESAFAGVKKTVDATDQELQGFRDEIRGMAKDIPQTASSIAGVAEAAGQLGIKNENLIEFTRVMSDLGVATNMSSTEAATSLARLANITQMPQEKFSNLGSTIVALGNNLATTESEITEMGLRLAGAGSQVGMTEAQILGLAGAISSVGIEADAGGSAVSTVMAKMQLAVEKGGESLDQFAEVAGMSASEFQQAFRDDAAQAIVAFVTGLGTMEERGQSAIATLDGMEITEIRQRDALLRLSGAGDVLSESLDIATQAWSDNNALTNEAEQRYQTLESRLQILKNNVADFGISIYDSLRDPLKNTVEDSIGYVQRLHDAFKKGGLSGVVKELGGVFEDVADNIAGTSKAAAGIVTPIKNITKAGGELAKTVLPVLGEGLETAAINLDALIPAIAAGTAGYKAFNTIGKVTAATAKANAAATAALAKMEEANALQLVATNGGLTARQAVLAVHNTQITATTALTGLWTKAQTALNTAMSANPIGVAVAATVALIGAGMAVSAVVNRQTEEEREHAKALKESAEAAKENLEKARERKQSYEELVQSQNEQAAGEIAQLDRLAALNNELSGIVDANGRVKEGEEARAAFITSQLSSALGLEISLTDGQISNYQELQGEIQNLIQQKRVEAVLSAQEAKYQEAVNNQMQVAAEASGYLTAMTQAQNDVTAEKAELSQLELEKDQAVIDGNKALVKVLDEKIKKQQEDVEAAEEALKSSQESYQESTQLLAQYANDIDAYTALAEAAATGNAEAIEQAIAQVTNGIKTASNATKEELQEQVVSVSNMEAMIKKEVEEGAPGFTQAMLDQAREGTTAALEEFAKAAPQTAEELSKVPPEAVAALVAGNMKGELSAEAKGAVEGMLKEFDGMDEETQATFANVIYGALEGLEGFEQIADPAKEGVTAFLETLIEELAVHSPSRAVQEIFANVWPGASEGLGEGQEDLSEKGKGVIEGFLTSIGGEELFERVKGIGSNIMSFLGIGIDSQKGSVDGTAKGISDSLNVNLGSADTQATGSQKAQEYNSGIGSQKEAIDTTSEVISDSSNTIFGSADTQGTGSRKAQEYDQGINSQKGIIDLDSKTISDSSNTILGSADTWGTGSRKGAEYDRGLGSRSGAINATSVGLSNIANTGMGTADTGATGSQQGAEYAEGVGSQTDNANAQGESLSSEANTGASSADGYGPGSDFGSGFVRGIGAWLGDAAAAAASLASRAYNALRRTLDEHSPSRKSKKSGKNFDLGLAGGIEDNAKYAVSAAEGLAEDALGALDMSQARDKIKSIDIPEAMSRVYMAVEDRKERIAARMSSGIVAKENAEWGERARDTDVHLSDEDIRKLAREFARVASASMANELEGMGMYANDRELFRMVREVGRR